MRFCTSCGKVLAGESFCTSCGTPVPSSADSAAPWAGAPRPGRPRGRSPLTTGLVALTVVLAAAAAGTLLLRDEEPAARSTTLAPVTSEDRDEAPEQSAAPEDDSGEAPEPWSAPAPTAAPSSPPPPTGAVLPSTPFHVAIIASKSEAEGGVAAVQPLAAEIEAAGFPALVFSSQEHSSLRCCYWVAAAGPFPDAAAAGRAATAMRELSPTFETAYPRCVGQAAQCP